jgi:hypothetical protein
VCMCVCVRVRLRVLWVKMENVGNVGGWRCLCMAQARVGAQGPTRDSG